jgi:hypothetical protein
MGFGLFVASVLSLSNAVFSQGLPPGTYQGTRLCSDGSIPDDAVSKYSVLLELGADGSYTTVADLFKTDGHVCTEVVSGRYRFANKILVTTNDSIKYCGDCGDDDGLGQDSISETSADLELTKNGFVLRLFSHYQEGGSCKAGQHLIIDFQRTRGPLEKADLVCKSIEAF